MTSVVPSSESVDAAMTREFGVHGTWVMAIEVFDDQGQQALAIRCSPNSTRWADAGLAHALSATLDDAVTQAWRADDD